MTDPVREWNAQMSMPTGSQLDFIHDLQRRLHLSAPALSTLCEQRFDCPFTQITKTQASHLIDEMKGWKAAPADLQREMGQLDLLKGVG